MLFIIKYSWEFPGGNKKQIYKWKKKYKVWQHQCKHPPSCYLSHRTVPVPPEPHQIFISTSWALPLPGSSVKLFTFLFTPAHVKSSPLHWGIGGEARKNPTIQIPTG